MELKLFGFPESSFQIDALPKPCIKRDLQVLHFLLELAEILFER